MDALWDGSSHGSTDEAGFVDRSTGRGNYGAKVGRPIVINREYGCQSCGLGWCMGGVVMRPVPKLLWAISLLL